MIPSRQHLLRFAALLLLVVAASCGDNVIRDSAKSITRFSVLDVNATIEGSSIRLALPFGTAVSDLVPTIEFEGARISPESGVAQDFSNPVAYTVTAEDGSTATYTATLTVAKNPAKELTAYAFRSSANAGLSSDVVATINGTAISATVPFGTDVTALVATFTHTGAAVQVGATAQVSGTTPNNFTSPVTYTVTAADGTMKLYTVTVTVAPSTAKSITAYAFQMANNNGLAADVIAFINGTTITATVPFGTDVTALVASFTTTGASVRVGPTTQVSGTTPNDFSSSVQYVVTAADGSTQTYTVTVTIALDSAKALGPFEFLTVHNPGLAADVTATLAGTSFSATVPFGTDVTSLVATFATTGANVAIGGVTQTSGVTANDFTSPVQYTVTAADNSTQVYTVTVSIALNAAKDLGPFQFFSSNNPALSVDVTASISGTHITAIVPFGSAITSLIPTFTTTGTSVTIGAITQVSGITANDYTLPVVYTVHAADGTTRDYTVTVINSLPGDKNIIQFTINGVGGIVSGTDITVTLPFGTPVTALVPTIVITGVSVNPASGTPQDFTNPVPYTVTAADNTTKTYTVTVVLAGGSDKDITRFTVNGLDAVIATVTPTTGIITLNMPKDTSLVGLSPVITINGVSVSPASGVPQDFSSPVQYVVTAADMSTKTYTVTLDTVNGNGTKLISSFTILGVAGTITNGAQSSTVTLVLPAGTNLDGQTPTIVINGSSLSPPSGVPQDFRTPVIYTVTAADMSTRVYTVTVTTQ